MDTNIWGPPMWNLLSELIRLGDEKYSTCDDIENVDSVTIANVVDVINGGKKICGKKYILPCSYCRDSFRFYTTIYPPEDFKDLDEWVWIVKDLVNEKLEKSKSLSLEKWKKRLYTWSCFLCQDQIWDIIFILSLNYPKKEKKTQDKEFHEKQFSYFVFFTCLSFMLAHSPKFKNMSNYLCPGSWSACTFSDRMDFVEKIKQINMDWMISVKKSKEEIADILERRKYFMQSLW